VSGEFLAWIVISLIYAVPVAIVGILLSKLINRNRDFVERVRWPFHTGLVLALLVFLGQCSSLYVNDGGSAKLSISQQDRGSANGRITSEIDESGRAQLTDEAIQLLHSIPAWENVELKGSTNQYAINGHDVLKTSVWRRTTLVALRYLDVRNNRFVVTACLREDLSELIDRDKYFCEKRVVEASSAGGGTNG
jgi:hypothetical protein